MVLVKAQATTRKGIAMRLFVTILLALWASSVSSKNVSATCEVTENYNYSKKFETNRALPSETERYLEYNSDDMESVRFGLRGVTSKFQEHYDRIDVPWESQGIFVQTTLLVQKVLTIWNPLCDMTLPIDRSVSITTIHTNRINYQELQCTCFGQ